MKYNGCVYRRTISGAPTGDKACHYLIDTGEPRGCSAKECYTNKIHYAPKTKKDNANKPIYKGW